MTVKEFYDYCVNKGLKNAKILVTVSCGDDYYSFDNEPLTKEQLKPQRDNAICIVIDN